MKKTIAALACLSVLSVIGVADAAVDTALNGSVMVPGQAIWAIPTPFMPDGKSTTDVQVTANVRIACTVYPYLENLPNHAHTVLASDYSGNKTCHMQIPADVHYHVVLTVQLYGVYSSIETIQYQIH